MTRETTVERLTRIETILETALAGKIDEMAADIKAIRADLDADKAELAALKNKGSGLLIGVGIAGGAFGAAATKLWNALFG